MSMPRPAWALALLVWGCKPGHAPRGLDAGSIVDAAVFDARVEDARAHDGGTDAGSDAEIGAMPPSSSDELTARMRHLMEAVVQDNPELGLDVVFPRDAYLKSFDALNPGKIYDEKLLAPFRKSVHVSHKRIKGVERATFVSFELGRSVTQTLPRKRDLKVPLWRVRHSRVLFDVEGKTQRLDIAEMVSWRGAWYVTRLR